MRLGLLLFLLLGLAWASNPARDRVDDRFADSDQDGFPDIVEIHSESERAAFRDWFAAVAEAQYAAPSPTWHAQDCSGLLRFAFVQALAPKTPTWFSQFAYLPTLTMPPVKTVTYPLPVLSRSAFRIAPGAYDPLDVAEGRIVGAATAGELMRFSSVFLGRTVQTAVRGDLLFFMHPLAEGSGYHSMVYLGDGMVVYHTGASPEAGGEVRLLSLDTLAQHPDPSWHPVASNPNFMGFFRWKILD